MISTKALGPKYLLLIFCFGLILLTSCSGEKAAPTKVETPNPTSLPAKSDTPTPQPTGTWIPIEPVGQGTQVPESAAPISINNLNRFTLLSRWGNGNISKIQYSPDSQSLVVGSSTGLYIYKVGDYSLVHHLETNSSISDIAISPDNKLIAALSDDKVLFFDFYSGMLLRAIDVKATCIAFSPDSELLATGTSDGLNSFVELWNPSDGSWVRAFQDSTYGGWFNTIAFSPHGTLIATGTSTTAIWSLDGKLIDEQGPYNSGGNTYSLSFSPDGTLLAEGSDDDAIHIWKVLDNGRLINFRQIALHDYGVASVSISPDGKMLAAGQRGSVNLWDLRSGRLERTFTTDTAESRSIAWSVDGEHLAASNNNGVEVWNTRDGAQLAILDNYSVALNTLDWSPTGKMLAVGTNDGVVRLMDAKTGDLVHSLMSSGGVQSIDFSPNGIELAVGLDRDKIEIWALNGSLSTTLQGVLNTGGTYVAFSPDGSELLSNISTLNPGGKVYGADSLRVWQTSDWTPAQSWKIGELVLVTNLELSPNGKTVALARVDSDWVPAIEVWDLDLGEKTNTINAGIWSLSFSPDGRKMVSLSRETVGYFYAGTMSEKVTVWDTDTWEPLWVSKDLFAQRKGLPGYYPDEIAWSSDGSLIAFGTPGGQIQILNANDGTLLQTINGHTKWVTGVQFSPDGRKLASVSMDGTVRLWGIR